MLQFNSMHFLNGEELSKEELTALIETADVLKHRRDQAHCSKPLQGKTVALMFDKPSLRTRVSFTVGVQELGGSVMELQGSQKKHEDPEDTIRVLQGMVHGLMWRTFEHANLERMVTKATIPVINGLSDTHHPCQAIADLLTLKQCFGQLQGLRIAYVGDGNNVLHSLLLLAPYMGVSVHFSCPQGYQPDGAILTRAKLRAAQGGAEIKSFHSPEDAVVGCNAVYTDVWTSMGNESEKYERAEAFEDYQLNLKLFSLALPTAIAMHCLPMVKGQEITSDVVEHPRSALFQQAENRLHAQKALMAGLFNSVAKVGEKGFEYSHVI